MQEFWKVALSMAGLSAVAAFVLWSVYKQWLRLPIFQRMTKKQQFELFRLVIVFTFVFSIAGLATYGILQWRKSTTEADQDPMIVLVDSASRKTVLTELSNQLENFGLNIWFPIKSNWIGVANIIAKLKPQLVAVHFHALRGLDGRGHYESEEELLLGLLQIRAKSPETRILVFSSGFSSTSEVPNIKQIERAKDKLANGKNFLRSDLNDLVKSIVTTSWSTIPNRDDRVAMTSLVNKQLQQGQ
jgi:hypothetical protein